MSRLAPHRLTARKVAAHKNGDLADGGNLWLVVRGASRIWTFRYKSPVTDKRREMSLGSAYDVTLAEARTLAAESRRLVNQRIDPLEQRHSEEAARKRESRISFRAVAERYIESQKPGWRDPRAAPIWSASLELNVYPVFGDKPVTLVDTADVEAVLKPIWTEKTETATRVRGRIERVLDYARAQGWRTGENPARWKGHLSAILRLHPRWQRSRIMPQSIGKISGA